MASTSKKGARDGGDGYKPRIEADSASPSKRARRSSEHSPASRKQPAANATKDAAKDEDGSDNSEEGEEEAVLDRSKLLLASHPMPPIDGLVRALRQFKNLQKLDVSDMKPSDDNGNPEGLDSLAWIGKATALSKSDDPKDTFGGRLTWFKCSDNTNLGKRAGKAVWDGLDRLTNLTVLNASSCSLPIAPPASTLIAWPSLAALILGHNSISELSHIPHMPMLNTLVLSHNAITMLASDLPASLPALKKISITHNKLAWRKDVSPLPDFSVCSHLREVRISGNTHLTRLPTHLRTWGRGIGKDRKGTGLEIFEAGDCGLADWDAIAPLLPQAAKANDDDPKEDMVHPSRRRVRGLSTLHLRGNEVARLPDYRERILALHTGLRVLDSEKVGRGVAPPPVVAEEPTTETKEAAHESTRRQPTTENRPGKASEREHVDASKTERKSPNHERRTEGHEKTKTPKVKSKVTGPAQQQQQQLDDNIKKERKRGSRGKAKGGQNGKAAEDTSTPTMRDPFLESASKKRDDDNLARIKARAGPASKAEGKKSLKAAKKSSADDDADMARIRARAGPGVDLSSKKGKEGAKRKDAHSNAPAAAQPSKKRKAWDEDVGAMTDKKNKASVPDSPQPTAPPPKREDAPATKEITSVAGVIEVKGGGKGGASKKKIGKLVDGGEKAPSVWAQVKQTKDVSLGQGGAWD